MTETHPGVDKACHTGRNQGWKGALSISGPDAINYMHMWKNEIKSLIFAIDKNKFQVHQRAIRDV